jgi:hypothetical protein
MTESMEEKPADESGTRASGFTGGAMPRNEPRSWKPFLIAGVVVLMIVGVLLAVSHHGQTPASQPGTLSAADPYAVSLPITGIQMSDSSGISGDKQTYLDGTVSNHGNKTVTGITVQVAFQDYNGHPAAIDTMPLTLIRFLKPYVDTVPVSMAPIQPGQSRSFRLIFDATPQSWGGAYPEVRVTSVDTR